MIGWGLDWSHAVGARRVKQTWSSSYPVNIMPMILLSSSNQHIHSFCHGEPRKPFVHNLKKQQQGAWWVGNAGCAVKESSRYSHWDERWPSHKPVSIAKRWGFVSSDDRSEFLTPWLRKTVKWSHYIRVMWLQNLPCRMRLLAAQKSVWPWLLCTIDSLLYCRGGAPFTNYIL